MSENKSKTRYISVFLRIIVAVTALYLVFHGEDIKTLWSILTRLSPGVMLLVFIMYLAGQFFFVVRWRLILSVQSVHISVLTGFKLHMVGLFYNNCLPGAVGGDLLRAWYVSRHAKEEKRVEAALSVFFDRIVGLTGMILMAIVAYWLVPVDREQIRAQGQTAESKQSFWVWILHYGEIFAAIVGILFLLLVAVYLIPKSREKINRYVALVCHKFVHLYLKFWIAVKLYFKRPLTVLAAYGLTFLCQALPILGYWIMARDMHMDAHVKYFFAFFPVSWILGSLPVSIGGVGIMEGLVKRLFQTLEHVTSEQALAVAISQRLVLLVGSLPGILIHLFGGHLPARKEEIFIDEPDLEG